MLIFLGEMDQELKFFRKNGLKTQFVLEKMNQEFILFYFILFFKNNGKKSAKL